MTDPLTREQIKAIAVKLSGWALNAEVDALINEWLDGDAALRQQLEQAQRDYEAACHLANTTSEAWKQAQRERDEAQNELCTAEDQIPPDMEGDSLSVSLIKLKDERRALQAQLARQAKRIKELEAGGRNAPGGVGGS